MPPRIGLWALASAVIIGGASAALGGRSAPPTEPIASESSPPPASFSDGDPHGTGALPPGHPPIGSSAGSLAGMPPAADEPAAITWRMPSGWTDVPNASKMRLATYRVPRAKGDDDDAELTVSRAGGSTEANVQRWIGQFDDADKDTREERVVHGLKVTIVEVGGTYLGGKMSPSSRAARRPASRLLGAVVETPNGSSYFFKLTGPAASVRAARPAFVAMIAALAPAS